MILQSDKFPHPVYAGFMKTNSLEAFLEDFNGEKPIYIICDNNTLIHCLPILREKLNNSWEINYVDFPEGEQSKNLETCEFIWRFLSKHNLKKDSLIVNLGGGVVSDIGGFCASLYKRGVDFINIPTSLIGMVDASLGGKTGIDHNNIKNIIGNITFPKAVFIDINFLKTLPRREFMAGYNEMIKHGLIADKEYFYDLTRDSTQTDISIAVDKSIRIKMDIVATDPQENSFRKVLNFGHTIGHAIESSYLKHSNKSVLHGEAVLLGMIAECKISLSKGLMEQGVFDDILIRLAPRINRIKIDNHSIEDIIQYIMFDKKNKQAGVNFTLLEYPGKPVIDQNASFQQIRESLSFLSELSYNKNG